MSTNSIHGHVQLAVGLLIKFQLCPEHACQSCSCLQRSQFCNSRRVRAICRTPLLSTLRRTRGMGTGSARAASPSRPILGRLCAATQRVACHFVIMVCNRAQARGPHAAKALQRLVAGDRSHDHVARLGVLQHTTHVETPWVLEKKSVRGLY